MAPVMDETNIVLRQFANLHTFGRVVSRAVVSGGARDALAPPEFRSSVNPIPTIGGRLCPPDNCYLAPPDLKT